MPALHAAAGRPTFDRRGWGKRPHHDV